MLSGWTTPARRSGRPRFGRGNPGRGTRWCIPATAQISRGRRDVQGQGEGQGVRRTRATVPNRRAYEFPARVNVRPPDAAITRTDEPRLPRGRRPPGAAFCCEDTRRRQQEPAWHPACAPLKIGVIGLGDIARKAYLPVLAAHPAELHLHTRTPATSEQVGEAHRLPRTATPRWTRCSARAWTPPSYTRPPHHVRDRHPADRGGSPGVRRQAVRVRTWTAPAGWWSSPSGAGLS